MFMYVTELNDEYYYAVVNHDRCARMISHNGIRSNPRLVNVFHSNNRVSAIPG